MNKNDAPLSQTLCEGGADVILAEVLEQRVLRQNRQSRKRSDHVAQHGQKHVMDLRDDLLEEAEEFPVVRAEAAEREQVPEAPPSGQDQQSGPQRPSRNRVSQEHEETAGEIKARAMPNRFEYTQRYTNDVAQEKAGQ